LTRHKDFTVRTGVAVYFRDSRSPWQRGTCENTNRLLRRYLPKGTDLSTFTQDDLDALADNLDSRPRATHAFHSPPEVFARILALTHRPPGSIQ
jgi:IS30 family transposase